jgi:hypothetical protein
MKDLSSSLAARFTYVVPVALFSIGCSSSSSSKWNYCNGLPPPQVTFTATAGAGAAPTPSGGTIVPGTYDVTADAVYGASMLPTGVSPEEYVFTESTFQGVTLNYAADEGSWSASGTTLTLSYNCLCKASDGCSTPAPASFGYTATPTQILFIESGFTYGGTTVQTYTKR